MASKTKPSDWQPSDLQILEGFENLYPEDVRQTIVEAVPDNIGAEERRALVSAAIVIALEAYVAQKHADRATVPERREGLSGIQHKAAELSVVFSVLDHDGALDLYDAAGADVEENDLKNISLRLGLDLPNIGLDQSDKRRDARLRALPDAQREMGRDRIADIQRQIEKLQEWCQQALDSIGEARRGPQSKDAVKTAMVKLATALEKASGKAPSRTSVIGFAAAALSPVVGEIDFDWHWRTRATV